MGIMRLGVGSGTAFGVSDGELDALGVFEGNVLGAALSGLEWDISVAGLFLRDGLASGAEGVGVVAWKGVIT